MGHSTRMQAHFEFHSAAALHARYTLAFPSELLGLAARYGAAHVELALTRGRWVGLHSALILQQLHACCSCFAAHIRTLG